MRVIARFLTLAVVLILEVGLAMVLSNTANKGTNENLLR